MNPVMEWKFVNWKVKQIPVNIQRQFQGYFLPSEIGMDCILKNKMKFDFYLGPTALPKRVSQKVLSGFSSFFACEHFAINIKLKIDNWVNESNLNQKRNISCFKMAAILHKHLPLKTTALLMEYMIFLLQNLG